MLYLKNGNDGMMLLIEAMRTAKMHDHENSNYCLKCVLTLNAISIYKVDCSLISCASSHTTSIMDIFVWTRNFAINNPRLNSQHMVFVVYKQLGYY